MIYIDRNAMDSKGIPIKPNAAWFMKAKEMTKTAKDEKSRHKVTDHYKHEQVKIALKKLFHGKCAYCEDYLSDFWDVEHFRPKGKVKEDPNHPGYYWLAYEWSNLYASCQGCNRLSTELDDWDDEIKQDHKPEGKDIQFPLQNPDQRACAPEDNLELEQPLLLDPCNEALQPEGRIRYGLDGRALAADGDLQAEETIRICNLNRKRLRNQVREALKVFIISIKSGDHVAPEDDIVFAGALRGVLRDPDSFGLNLEGFDR